MTLTEDLDKRLEDAGMISLTDMIDGESPLVRFLSHAAVSDHASFEWWLRSSVESSMHLRMQYELGDKPKDDMYEWAFAKSSALLDVWKNWQQMKRRRAQEGE